MGKYMQAGTLALALIGATASPGAADLLIEDFGADADRRWGYVADRVMGGVSQGQLRFETEDTQSFARLTGTVSTDNNGGFIQFRASVRDGLPDWTSGLRLKVKGNSAEYYVFLRTTDMRRPWHSYRASFETTGDWQTVDMDLSAFKSSRGYMPKTLDPTKVIGIGIVAYGRDFEADLSVSEIRLLQDGDA